MNIAAPRSDLLTNSRMKTGRRCLREEHIQYELGYRSIHKDENLDFGTLVHAGLEAWWRAPADRLMHALAAMQSADPFELAKARVLLRGYDVRWGADAEKYGVLGVEVEFRAPLRNPATGAASRTWTLAGKIDVLVREIATGRVLVVEHKTSSEDISTGSDYWKRLRIDGQVSTYFDGGAALGYQVDGCLYDVLGKPSLRPSAVPLLDGNAEKIVLDANGERVRTKDGKRWRQTADTALGYVLQTRPETPDEYEARLVDAICEDPNRYYARYEIARLEEDLAEARFDAWQIGKQLAEARRFGRAPRNPDACMRFGKTCAYFGVCTREQSLDDTSRFIRLDVLHPELSAEVAK